MKDLDGDFPAYGFAEHKGYSTPEHQAALVAHGATSEHRMSYQNVAAVAGPGRVRSTVGAAVGVASGGQGAPPASMGENTSGTWSDTE